MIPLPAYLALTTCPTVPFSGRTNWYAELDTRATHTGDVNWTSFLTLTLPAGEQDASTDYYLFGSSIIDYSTAGADSYGARLQNTTDTATLGEARDLPAVGGGVAGEGPCFFSMARYQSAGTPASKTFGLEYKTYGTSRTVGMAYGRLWAVKADAADRFVEAAGPTQVSTDAFGTVATLSWTPGSTGNYVLFFSGEIRNEASSSNGWQAKLDKSGALVTQSCENTSFLGGSGSGGTTWMPFGGFIRQTALSGAQTYTVQIRNINGFTGTVSARNVRILALREDAFNSVSYAEARSRTTYNTNTSDSDKVTNTATAASSKQYIAMISGVIDGASTGAVVYGKGKHGSTMKSVASMLSNTNLDKMPFWFFDRFTGAGSSVDYKGAMATANASVAVGGQEYASLLIRTQT